MDGAGHLVLLLNSPSSLPMLLAYCGFLIILVNSNLRWRVVTYRRACVLLLICAACSALGSLSYEFLQLKFYATGSTTEPFDNIISSLAVIMRTVVKIFGPISAASIALLILRDRGIELLGTKSPDRKGLDPYDHEPRSEA